MRKVLIVLAVIIGGILYFKEDIIIIPNDSIRIRIISNSNSIKDLYNKKRVKDIVQNELYNLVGDSQSTLVAEDTILNSIPRLESKIENLTDIPFNINYGFNYFPKKTYKGVLYNEGNYKSLVITLGKGVGDNWWCVLYPPLCMIEDNAVTSDVEYKFFVKEVLKNITNN